MSKSDNLMILSLVINSIHLFSIHINLYFISLILFAFIYIISLLFTANKDKLINLTCVITGPYGGPGKVFQGGGEIWLLFINLLLAQIECFYHHREHTIFIQTWEMSDWVFVLNNIMSVESAELYHSSKDAKTGLSVRKLWQE